MTCKRVTDRFAVAPQLSPEALPALVQDGFNVLVCNRPDGEDDDQPAAEVMRAAAESAGMRFYHIPVAGGAFPAEAVAAFGQVRREAGGKVLAYCRTGTRSITLDALANPEGLSVADRLELAGAAGYDLSALTSQLAE
tara:strand:- start:1458 stop:1871 length:414 start_codon:yes stop_codon:yes gene_type:complete